MYPFVFGNEQIGKGFVEIFLLHGVVFVGDARLMNFLVLSDFQMVSVIYESKIAGNDNL